MVKERADAGSPDQVGLIAVGSILWLPKNAPIGASLPSTFEIRDEAENLNGTFGDEIMTIWPAVMAAEEIAKAGVEARILSEPHGREIEGLVARVKTKK